MNVILLTVFIGLVLVFFFVYLFVYQTRTTGRVVNERDALLPLEKEGAMLAQGEGKSVEVFSDNKQQD